MERTLPRPLDWRWIAVASVAVIAVYANALLLSQLIPVMLTTNETADYTRTFVPLLSAANPYDENSYQWSPLMVPVLRLVVPLGIEVWYALHVAALLLIRPWWVAGLVAVSWPFWWDMASGNIGIFVFVAAWWAVKGSRIGIIAFLTLALLVPRPLMIPVLGWVLWKAPWTRVPFVVAAVAHLAIVVGMGLLDDWIVRLTTTAGTERGVSDNLAATRWLPYPVWAAIFLPLAAWLTYRGRLGLASLAISPYIFPLYLLMGFLELRGRDPHVGGHVVCAASSPGVEDGRTHSSAIPVGANRIGVGGIGWRQHVTKQAGRSDPVSQYEPHPTDRRRSVIEHHHDK